jgi:hypothetical protein
MALLADDVALAVASRAVIDCRAVGRVLLVAVMLHLPSCLPTDPGTIGERRLDRRPMEQESTRASAQAGQSACGAFAAEPARRDAKPARELTNVEERIGIHASDRAKCTRTRAGR